MLLKHNLTVASDIMSACSTNEHSTPNEMDQGKKTPKDDKILNEDSTSECRNEKYKLYLLSSHLAKLNFFKNSN